MRINLEMAKSLAELTNPRPKACWRNSLNAMLRLRFTREDQGHEVRYVEGITVLPMLGNLTIEHGWLTFDDDIVDVTFTDLAMHVEDYHPVRALTYQGVMDELEKNIILPLYAHDSELTRIAWGKMAMLTLGEEKCRQLYNFPNDASLIPSLVED